MHLLHQQKRGLNAWIPSMYLVNFAP